MKLIFKTSIAAIAISIAGTGAAEAAAVKYYSRQVLNHVSAPNYTYVPAYGTYGACSGGTQSASISSCTRSDGTVVANSFCSPATKSQNCATTIVSCGTLVGSRSLSGYSTFTSVGSTSSLAAAKTLCENKMTQAGVCYVEDPSRTQTTFNVYTAVGGASTSSSNTWTYSSNCVHN